MSGDGVPQIAKLDTDNYLKWSFETEHIMRFKACWPAVAPTGYPLSLLGGVAGPTVTAVVGGAAGTSVTPSASIAARTGGAQAGTVGGG